MYPNVLNERQCVVNEMNVLNVPNAPNALTVLNDMDVLNVSRMCLERGLDVLNGMNVLNMPCGVALKASQSCSDINEAIRWTEGHMVTQMI